MKRTIIILVGTLVLVSALSARVIRRKLSIFNPSVPETETVAQGRIEFVYDYSFARDTTDRTPDNRESDRMLLQVGEGGVSKFSSYKNLSVDSMLMQSTQEQIVQATIDGLLEHGDFMTIYKNLPEGRLTQTEKICMDWFRYDEPMPAIAWEPVDTTATILGYECAGARCSFGGREWTAFYTEDIPVMEGPWKLCGLPGMIMAASDADGDYTFECIGLRSRSDRPLTMYKVPFINTDRHGFYDAKHRYDVNPYAYYEATTGGSVTVMDEAGNLQPDAHDPMELGYDYIEKDWRK